MVRYTVLADCALALGREDMGLVPKLGGGGRGRTARLGDRLVLQGKEGTPSEAPGWLSR